MVSEFESHSVHEFIPGKSDPKPIVFCRDKEIFNVKIVTFKAMTAAQIELNKLEKKVELLSKAMHLLLFEKKEVLSKKESKEIEKRLSVYLKGKKGKFVIFS
jgi:hypothetical protein